MRSYFLFTKEYNDLHLMVSLKFRLENIFHVSGSTHIGSEWPAKYSWPGCRGSCKSDNDVMGEDEANAYLTLCRVPTANALIWLVLIIWLLFNNCVLYKVIKRPFCAYTFYAIQYKLSVYYVFMFTCQQDTHHPYVYKRIFSTVV